MQSFDRLTGVAAPFLRANVDTDVIMPKQFLKGVDREGLAAGVFFDLRFNEAKQPQSTFILNDPAWRDASFLVVGPNFGCGSSREHAVWGLLQLGIRVLIGTSFAGIFFDNCARNGLLAITLPPDSFQVVAKAAESTEGNRMTVDLKDQTILLRRDTIIRFEIDPLQKEMILYGLDAIDVTLKNAPDIVRFEAAHFKENPWLAVQSAET
jgi:3-isopropylmalate/(R)-2-methylmalate dehydratase small subunit